MPSSAATGSKSLLTDFVPSLSRFATFPCYEGFVNPRQPCWVKPLTPAHASRDAQEAGRSLNVTPWLAPKPCPF